MKAPGFTRAEQRTEGQRLIVLPDARPRRASLAVAAAAAVALVLGFVLGILPVLAQRGDLRRTQAALDAARADLAAAGARAAAVEALIADLEGRIVILETDLDAAILGRDVSIARRAEALRLVEQLEAQLADARAELISIAGAPLPDGERIGYVVALNPGELMLVFDPALWFTGAAAIDAAVEDGAIDEGGDLPHPRYVRNAEDAWRVVRLAPGTTVTLRRYRGDGSTVVSLTRFLEILKSRLPADRAVARAPFWVTVDDGRVEGIVQQLYP
jgi:multidrug efflux pump subunit AcrA (membrane-fusion protein)